MLYFLLMIMTLFSTYPMMFISILSSGSPKHSRSAAEVLSTSEAYYNHCGPLFKGFAHCSSGRCRTQFACWCPATPRASSLAPWSHDRGTDARSGAIMWTPLCCPTCGVTVSRILSCFTEALISRETSSHWYMMGIVLSQIVVIVTWGVSQYLHWVQRKKSQLTYELPPLQLKQLVFMSWQEF